MAVLDPEELASRLAALATEFSPRRRQSSWRLLRLVPALLCGAYAILGLGGGIALGLPMMALSPWVRGPAAPSPLQAQAMGWGLLLIGIVAGFAAWAWLACRWRLAILLSGGLIGLGWLGPIAWGRLWLH